ncbi:cytochrome P450 [Lepidopterella palustris CBS 459.81]|uniref:Cytochrome P450 n=1 Tax=Lepidopterella palustris CBS 459.81 TaxID=1314670 RepID=A0A8E2E1A3_9PEZI|nr:cytochrome P450 [Lepidopterella palustris CBS 459.81]
MAIFEALDKLLPGKTQLPGGYVTYLAATSAILIGVYKLLTYDKRRSHLPPGPKGLPFIGSLLDFADSNKLPEVCLGWAQKYGKISYAKIGGTDFVFLNTPTVVKDLMDKRGQKYSDRPHMPMAFDAVSNKKRQFFMPYGDQWRNVRRISHAALNLKTSSSYKPVQDFESKQVLYDLLHAKNDTDFYDINRRYSNSLIMLITYGRRIPNFDDPAFKKIFRVLDHFSLMAEPGAWLVDAFPSLAKLPSWMVQNWWKIGREWHAEDSAIYLEFYRDLVAKIKNGTAPDCFVRDFYEGNPEKNGIDEEGAAYAAGTLVEAGSESTSTAINSWLLACLLYPNVVKAAQEELDRVVGPDRMPTFEDEDNLPYIRAMAKETLRWRPITKIGVSHSTTEDDWYEGYFIPKGSVVVLNWWSIHFDDKFHKNPQDFEPARYVNDPLSTAEALNASNPEARDHYTYGAGRRVCSGIHVAQNSMFINMARTLWAFNVKKAKGPDGREITPPGDMEDGFLCVPKKFECHFEPRSAKHAKIVEESWTQAEREGLSWMRTKHKI